MKLQQVVYKRQILKDWFTSFLDIKYFLLKENNEQRKQTRKKNFFSLLKIEQQECMSIHVFFVNYILINIRHIKYFTIYI